MPLASPASLLPLELVGSRSPSWHEQRNSSRFGRTAVGPAQKLLRRSSVLRASQGRHWPSVSLAPVQPADASPVKVS